MKRANLDDIQEFYLFTFENLTSELIFHSLYVYKSIFQVSFSTNLYKRAFNYLIYIFLNYNIILRLSNFMYGDVSVVLKKHTVLYWKKTLLLFPKRLCCSIFDCLSGAVVMRLLCIRSRVQYPGRTKCL